MQIFSDFEKDSRVKTIDSYQEPNNAILKKLQKLHYSRKINHLCRLPFKGIWGYPLDNIEWKDDTQYYVLFINASLFPISPSYLMRMKKKHNIKYILYCFDTRNTSGFQDVELYLRQVDFDYIFTFDFSDSKRYGYLYYNLPYSKLPIKPCEITKDLYYVGSSIKGLSPLHELYYKSRENNVSSIYRLTSVKEQDQDVSSTIIYNSPINYFEMLQEMNSANCILEYVRPEQDAPTSRYYEAICYNKKLLTNFKSVINSPFYNPDYIQFFEKPEDIDWDWVKERIPVDYHYDGRFSPIRLIDKIIELEEAKEKIITRCFK